MRTHLLALLAVSVVLGQGIVACSSGASDEASSEQGDTLSASSFIITNPLALDKTSVAPGDTLHATVTYKNVGGRAAYVNQIAILGLPPGSTTTTGPSITFDPAIGATRVAVGASVTLSASYTFTGSEPTGAWSVFSRVQARSNLDGPGVPLTVMSGASSDAGTGGTDAGNDAAPPPPPSDGGGGSTGAGLHVSGNQLLDASGHVVHLHGVNRSGTEYACIQGWGIFDGPSDDASVAAIASWHSNIVRVPLNEDCWLGINGVNAAYGGANYRSAIVAYVNLLHQHGLYAELSLIWGAPGSNQATYQPGAPDADHSPAFWSSLASTFAGDPNVLLAPWGETIVNADCFLNGGTCEATYGTANTPYATAGMQQAVSVMRSAGYNGVIVIPGIDYANDLSQWLSHEPSDPMHQLMAEAHVYGKNTCSSTSCFDSTMAPVAAAVPLVFGEMGETYDDSSCGSTNTSMFMAWADAHGVGYEAWTWDTWGTCGSLISNYGGTPANAYATAVKSHYATMP